MASLSLAVVAFGLLFPAVPVYAKQAPAAAPDSSYTDPVVDGGIGPGAPDSYTGSYTADQVTSGPSDESNSNTLLARNDWLLGMYGKTPSSGSSQQLFHELQTQQAHYPQQAAGVQPPPGVAAWQSLGPTRDVRNFNGNALTVTDSGRLQAILPHPSDPNTVYVLGAGGGVWKTTDFTSPYPTWVSKTDAVFSTSGGSLAFGRDPQTLYLGLGDPFAGQAQAGGVMLRSTDGGDTWTPAPFIDLPGAGLVADVKLDSSQAQDIVMVGTDNGLFRSIDGGLTYSQAAGIPAGSMVWSLVQTSAGWLAATQPSCPASNNVSGGCFPVGNGSLYVSSDRGATWQTVTNSGGGYSGAGRTTLGVGLPGDTTVYAFAGTPDGVTQADLFRSVDGGRTWTPLHLNGKAPRNPNPDQHDMNLMGGQGWYNQMILVDPTDADRTTVYLGGQLSSAKSTDGGDTWTLLTNWRALYGLPYAHADFHCAAFSSLRSSPTLFFGNDGGLATSTNGGATFSTDKNQGLVDTLHYSVTTNPAHPESILTGLQDAGTRVRQGSTSIFNETLGGDGFGTAWSQTNGSVAMTSVNNDRIFTSSDPSQTKWRFTGSGINQGDTFFYTALISPLPGADPTGQVFFTTSLHHVYETNNGGRWWNSILNLGNGLVRPVINPLGISPLDTNHIAVAESGGGVLVTTDGGRHWRQSSIAGQVPGWVAFNSTVVWANNSVLYAASVSPSPHPRVAKSTDGGVHWQVASSGLPDVPVYDLRVNPADPNGGTVYAATFLGVYQTVDGGQSWHLFGGGLPAVTVMGLYMPPDGSFLRAATFGRGIWEIPTGPVTKQSPAAPRGPRTFNVPGDFATVQAAVDAAAPGDTIDLEPGTYSEQVTISKDLKIEGIGVGTSTIKAPANLQRGPIGGRRVIVTILNAANVTASKVNIAGPGSQPCTSPTSLQDGVLVVQNATLSIDSSALTDIRTGGGISMSCTGATAVRVGLARAGVDRSTLFGHVTIGDSTISGYDGTGLVVFGFASTAAIAHNRIIGPGTGAPYGVTVSGGATGTISDNTISGNLCDLPACGPDPINQVQSAGILIISNSVPTVISGNRISGNDIGTYLLGARGCCSDKGNTLTDNRYFGAVIQDGDNTLTGDSISGGQVGVGVVADAEDTVGTLVNVSISQTSIAPTQTLSCCGFAAGVVTQPH